MEISGLLGQTVIRIVPFPVVFALPSSFTSFALLLVLALRRTVLFALWLSFLLDRYYWTSGTAASSPLRVTSGWRTPVR